jgi:hypothetical protein
MRGPKSENTHQNLYRGETINVREMCDKTLVLTGRDPTNVNCVINPEKSEFFWFQGS